MDCGLDVIRPTGDLTVLMSGRGSEAAAAEICADWTRAGAGHTVAYVLQCTALSLAAAHCTPPTTLCLEIGRCSNRFVSIWSSLN